LDEVDRNILKHLVRDGRASYAEIGSALGIGSSTARWRVKRLEESGIICSYTCLPDMDRFGLTTAIFFLKVEKSIEGVVEALKRVERLTSIAVTFGDSNIVCRGVFKEIGDLLYLRDEVSSIPGLREVRVCITHKGQGMGGEVPGSFIETSEELDDVDRGILRVLIGDGRLGYAELGKRLGINASTARLRTKELVDRGIVRRFTARVDLTKVGQHPAFLRIKSRGGKGGTAVKKLGGLKELIMVLPCVGDCDIFCRAIVGGAEELNLIINEKILPIEEVVEVKADCTLKGERIGGFLPPQLLEKIA